MTLFLVALVITGTVVNGTNGKPQPGATVTLYKLGQDGMESIESAKSGPDGAFRIEKQQPGPQLLQTAYDGVTYNQMLPPGRPTEGIKLDVYEAVPQPGKTRLAQHMMLFEPSGEQMLVSEIFLFQNDGATTFDDPQGGTVKFYMPAESNGIVQVNATAPQGMPIRRTTEKTGQANVYKILEFPIKPGESRIDLRYLLPYGPKTVFAGRRLFPGETRLLAPPGVTLAGAALERLGEEPRTKTSIYRIAAPQFEIEIAGAGTLRTEEETAPEGPPLSQIMPRIFEGIEGSSGLWQKLAAAKWIVALTVSILALGFLLLYRAQPPARR